MADYTAFAIIGVQLPDQDTLPRLKVEVRKKAFKHSFEDTGGNEFDPKTGKPLWLDEYEEVESDVPSIVYETDEYDEVDPEDGQKVLKAPKGMQFHSGTDGEPNFLGFVVRTGNSNGGEEVGFKALPDITGIKSELKECLEPLELWDEATFGLYANLYCSY